MSEHDALMLGDDLELITRYLNNQLSPEQRADVERRLSTDQAFYDYVEPMLFAWTVAQHEVRKPRPEGELEAMWDKFTKRAGFVHQKKRAKARRLWMLAVVLAVVGVSGFLMRGRIQSAYTDWRDYAPVTADTGWVRLRDHIEVRLDPGARLLNTKVLGVNSQKTKLVGSARFRVRYAPSAAGLTPLVVETPGGGHAVIASGEVTMQTIGDTTLVEIPPTALWNANPTMVSVSPEILVGPIPIMEGDRMRLVKGRKPERIE